PTQSHRRVPRTKLVNDMILSPLSWALDRRMGECPPGAILVEDRAPRLVIAQGRTNPLGTVPVSVLPPIVPAPTAQSRAAGWLNQRWDGVRNAVPPISGGHIDLIKPPAPRASVPAG